MKIFSSYFSYFKFICDSKYHVCFQWF